MTAALAETVGAELQTLGMTNLHGVTWAVLLDGLLGGILGSVGAFGAALLAIWNERRQQQQRDQQRTAQEKEERRRRAVASITGLLRTLEAEVRWAPFLRNRTVLAFSEAMMVFEAKVGGDHPEVSRWLTGRYEALAPALQAWHRLWWLSPVKKRHLAPVAHDLGQLSGLLIAWSTGRLTDAEVVATRSDQKLPKGRP
jgi:hypothetical protein